jgi:hypothetical protein
MTAIELAEIVHEAWRAYDNAVLHHPGPDSTWAALPEWKREMFIVYVQCLLDGHGLVSAHEIITIFMDVNSYPSPLHHLWHELSPEQQKKGKAALWIVRIFG